MFQEKPDACIEYVKELHDRFDDRLAESPPPVNAVLGNLPSQVGPGWIPGSYRPPDFAATWPGSRFTST
jgi:hypothetical protein